MSNINLYGIPFRTWIKMNNVSVVSGSGEAEEFLGTSQFSSQERNTEGDRLGNMLHNIHDDFHTYFVLIIVILSAIVSAVIFVAVIFTAYSCCCSQPTLNKTSDVSQTLWSKVTYNNRSNNLVLQLQIEEEGHHDMKKTSHLPSQQYHHHYPCQHHQMKSQLEIV